MDKTAQKRGPLTKLRENVFNPTGIAAELQQIWFLNLASAAYFHLINLYTKIRDELHQHSHLVC